ncbi:hypothetical protein IQ10_03521 [Halalkalibacter nanhaiisediminis]|uniref:Uncharacterized protein n=1 Tax=Halalkalibacter nanhaiisediminis TaxID=688079 RepID=A0A562Q920_9BACI|nr:hypothetical protein IQ10_03521 [Halalkalibacter nanhaiisediminis]
MFFCVHKMIAQGVEEL